MKILSSVLLGVVLSFAWLPSRCQVPDPGQTATAGLPAAPASSTTSSPGAAATAIPGTEPSLDDSTSEIQPPTGSTLITSDELHSDQVTHVSIFTGDVVVVGTNFHMTCEEMTVNFTKDNKVDTIIATGNVVINQPDRVTHCGRADYFHDEDKFILTDHPHIHDHNNDVYGPKIIIYRTTQKMQVEGGRSNVILGPSSLSTPSTNAAPVVPTARVETQ